MRSPHLVFLSVSLVAYAQPLRRSAEIPRKAVFIILDGIPADVLAARGIMVDGDQCVSA